MRRAAAEQVSSPRDGFRRSAVNRVAPKTDLNRLRVFLAVHETKSVLGAARMLGVTPSAVSQSVKRLERELEFRLFQRVGNRLQPTDEAHELALVVEPFEETLALKTEELR